MTLKYVIILFLPLAILLHSASEKINVQYIIPKSSVSQCPTNYSCVTFAQYFQLHGQSHSSDKLMLHFLPGEHILEAQNYSIANASNVQLVGLPSNGRNVDLICNGDSKIFFDDIRMLRLEALHFISDKGKTCTIEVFSCHVCEIIDDISVNISIYLHFMTSLRAESIVISDAVSGQSMMIIEKYTGALSNFTLENNTATAAGKMMKVLHSIFISKAPCMPLTTLAFYKCTFQY